MHKKTGFRSCRLNSLSGPAGRGRRTGQTFFNFFSALRAGPAFLTPNFALGAHLLALGVALTQETGQAAGQCCGGCVSRA